MALGWRRPVVQAPMAGGPSMPALAAAVSEAGGLGFLAAGYRSPAAVRAEVRATRAATAQPFGVNVFVPGPPPDEPGLASYAGALRAEAERVGVALGAAEADDDAWEAEVSVLVEERVPVVSFSLGLPRPVRRECDRRQVSTGRRHRRGAEEADARIRIRTDVSRTADDSELDRGGTPPDDADPRPRQLSSTRTSV